MHVLSFINIGDNFFFHFQRPFGVFLIFKVSIWRYWLTFTDINGGTDSLKCWNSGINGCQNIKNFIWEQVLGESNTFLLSYIAENQGVIIFLDWNDCKTTKFSLKKLWLFFKTLKCVIFWKIFGSILIITLITLFLMAVTKKIEYKQWPLFATFPDTLVRSEVEEQERTN